jgi:hypothetical protein
MRCPYRVERFKPRRRLAARRRGTIGLVRIDAVFDEGSDDMGRGEWVDCVVAGDEDFEGVAEEGRAGFVLSLPIWS